MSQVVAVQPPNLHSVDVDNFGALGDGVTDDRAAIQAALDLGKDIHYTPGKMYRASAPLTMHANQTMHGNGATLKQTAQVHTTTNTAIVLNTTTQVTVASVTGLAVGMSVAFAQGSQGSLVIHTNLSSPIQITAIVGNVLTMAVGIDCGFTGTVDVYSTGFQIQTLAGVSGAKVEGLVLDGNVANHAWGRWETTCGVHWGGPYCTVRDCTLQNMPGEGILANSSYPTVENNKITTLNGNGIHFSGTTHGVVTGNRITNPNGNVNNGHAHGCIVWSVSVTDVVCFGNECVGGNYGFGSIDSNDNSDFTIIGNIVRNSLISAFGAVQVPNDQANRGVIQGNRIYSCGSGGAGDPVAGGISLSTSGTSTGVQHWILDGNYWESSGVQISGSNNPANNYIQPHAVKVRGNILVGCQLDLVSGKNIDITGNTIDRSGDTTSTCLMIDALVDQVRIDGNVLVGGGHGIQMTNSLVANRTVAITNNTISGFWIDGILIQGNGNIDGFDFLISGNQIRCNGGNSNAIGIHLSQRNICCKGNTCFAELNSGGNLIVVDSSWVIVDGNFLRGNCGGPLVLLKAPTTNCQVRNNYWFNLGIAGESSDLGTSNTVTGNVMFGPQA